MSTDTAPPTSTPKAQKTKKSKPESATKKRRHSQDTTTAEGTEGTEQTLAKRPRIAEPTTQTSPFIQQTTSFYLPISPIYHNFPVDGLCAEHISPLLLTYYPPVRGVLLSYSNPRLSDTPHDAPSTRDATDADTTVLAKSIDEYAVSYVWLTVDFVLLRPTPGSTIEGYVSVQNESYLGLVCWNFFNAGVERKRIPAEWKWVPGNGSAARSGSAGDWMKGKRGKADEGQGYYVDAEGKKVEGTVRFRVKDFESAPSSERERGFLSIEGTLLDVDEDKKVDAEVAATRKPKSKRRWSPGLSMV